MKALIDAVVIGGGFYGASIAIYLAEQRGFQNVLLVERESALLRRASYNNQARVHNGYHYPRSYTTAFRSRVNLPLFIRDWPDATYKDFTKLYAIARRNSKVTAKQFERFCRDIGAKIQPADSRHQDLFESRLIETAYLAEEYVFDASKLADQATHELKEAGIQIHLETRVTDIKKIQNMLEISLLTGEKTTSVQCQFVFNCTYSGLNQIKGDFPGTKTKLKQEITELALIKAPQILQNLGVTVMDGPFFSMMPFPTRGLHTLTHVRYTPHTYWKDERGINPYEKLQEYLGTTRVDCMLRDVERYLPSIHDAKPIDSLFEIKTILEKNENDDGRPILFEKHQELPGCYSILGGKIDNIYDVLERLNEEPLLT